MNDFINEIKDNLKKEIDAKGLDKKLEAQTGLTLKDLDNLPPMSFDDFCEFINKKTKEQDDKRTKIP